jgi:hypothetical protein
MILALACLLCPDEHLADGRLHRHGAAAWLTICRMRSASVTTVPARSVTPQPANTSGTAASTAPPADLPRFLTGPYKRFKRLVDDARSRDHNDVALRQVLCGRFIGVQRAARRHILFEDIDVIGFALDLLQNGPEMADHAERIVRTDIQNAYDVPGVPVRLRFIVNGVGRGGPDGRLQKVQAFQPWMISFASLPISRRLAQRAAAAAQLVPEGVRQSAGPVVEHHAGIAEPGADIPDPPSVRSGKRFFNKFVHQHFCLSPVFVFRLPSNRRTIGFAGE